MHLLLMLMKEFKLERTQENYQDFLERVWPKIAKLVTEALRTKRSTVTEKADKLVASTLSDERRIRGGHCCLFFGTSNLVFVVRVLCFLYSISGKGKTKWEPLGSVRFFPIYS